MITANEMKKRITWHLSPSSFDEKFLQELHNSLTYAMSVIQTAEDGSTEPRKNIELKIGSIIVVITGLSKSPRLHLVRYTGRSYEDVVDISDSSSGTVGMAILKVNKEIANKEQAFIKSVEKEIEKRMKLLVAKLSSLSVRVVDRYQERYTVQLREKDSDLLLGEDTFLASQIMPAAMEARKIVNNDRFIGLVSAICAVHDRPKEEFK